MNRSVCSSGRYFVPWSWFLVGCSVAVSITGSLGAVEAISYRDDIQPILADYCYACHGDGASEGNMTLDTFSSDESVVQDHQRWWRVLRQIRAELMPPLDEPRPSEKEFALLEAWIKSSVFALDPAQPDPGEVPVRRLNRIEYQNTVRDLLGVEYDTGSTFPADDTGHGFDNIANVLTISPLLMEKYFEAANEIVSQAVPTVSGVSPTTVVLGKDFQKIKGFEPPEPQSGADMRFRRSRRRADSDDLTISYYKDSKAAARVAVEHAGEYEITLDMRAAESYRENVFDYNKCRFVYSIDGEVVVDEEFVRQNGRDYAYTSHRTWDPGEHEFTIEVIPLTPEIEEIRSLRFEIRSLTVSGPRGDEYLVPPDHYDRYFPRPVPADRAARRQYAGELLRDFATRAFRRPADEGTVDRLTSFAESIYRVPGETFENGIAQAMIAVLSSPRFLFREESAQPAPPDSHPFVDEYSLASRLSYFLWSSMPDDELFRLAGENKLRENVVAQLERMLADPKSLNFFSNFAGQWLQARDIESVTISARAVVARETAPDPEMTRLRERFRELRRKPAPELTEEEKAELGEVRSKFFASFRRLRRFTLTDELREAMRRETEMLFEYIVRNDRSLLEVIDSRYTFLNESLASHYEIEGVKGDEMRRVSLPDDSPRGGVLTQGTFLAVTSNPDRTSPVKRGLFVLEKLLGTPIAAPPANVPPLAESDGNDPSAAKLNLRQSMEMHRSNPLCSSCHALMDPLGLALENFNALGRFREQEFNQPIEVKGELKTGEAFQTVQDLKKILATERRKDFYRCLTEHMLTYALGRGVDYRDLATVDRIVERLEATDGSPRELLIGVVQSVPFQKMRRGDQLAATNH